MSGAEFRAARSCLSNPARREFTSPSHGGQGGLSPSEEQRLTTGNRIITIEETTRSEPDSAYRSRSAGKDDLIMGVGFGRSSVADLTFQVFSRSLHPEWFATREFRRVEQKRWAADVRIVEGGHAVVFSSGSVRLSEVLSGPETVLPEPGRLFHSHLRRERSTMLRPGGSVEYQSCLEVERVDIEVFLHLCEEISLNASGNQLFQRFAASNRMAPPPISHIQLSARAGDLSIQCFHSFPTECAIVRTQSLFELKAHSK